MKLYTDTDQRLHLLSQLISKANRTFVPEKEDDSHTNLYFDAMSNRILGRWIETKEEKFLFALDLSNLNLDVINTSQQVLASYTNIGNTINEIEVEIEKDLSKLGLSESGYREKLHYEIPEYSFTSDRIASLHVDGLKEWKQFRQLANEACALLLGHVQNQEEIRIWPHHFDTGIYTVINDRLGIGFGLAMEDEMIGAPYFYMSGYALKGTMEYENLPEGNEWEWVIKENWKGAVLTLDRLAGKSHEEQNTILVNYMTTSFNWFITKW